MFLSIPAKRRKATSRFGDKNKTCVLFSQKTVSLDQADIYKLVVRQMFRAGDLLLHSHGIHSHKLFDCQLACLVKSLFKNNHTVEQVENF